MGTMDNNNINNGASAGANTPAGASAANNGITFSTVGRDAKKPEPEMSEKEKLELEKRQREEAEKKAKEDAKSKAEADKKAEKERKAQEAAEAKAKADAEKKAKEDAKRQEKEAKEAEKKAEAERKAQEAADKKAQAEAEKQAKNAKEAEENSNVEAEKMSKDEKRAQEEAQKKAEAEKKAQEAADKKALAEAEKKAQADKKAQEEAAKNAEPPRSAEEIKMDKVAEQELKLFADKCKRIFEEVRKDMIGQREVVESTIAAIIAGGNVLLEGAPGLGKTRLVRSLGKVFDLPFSRIQFTPDLMPADVTGTNVITKDEDGNSKFEFQKGPIFSNIVLADEINRATPKTQAALLEAMQEHKVTVMGVTRKMDEPFFVLATQNPIEQDGTYPLPEAQMDRFMFKILVPNPSAEELGQIVNLTHKTMDETAQAACNGEELLRMRAVAKTIPVSSEVLHYAMVLIASTHPDSEVATETTKRFIRAGASPRAAQAIITAAQVRALINGRYNVSYEDINSLAVPVLRHRLKLGFEAVTSKMTADDVVRALIADLNNVSTETVEKREAKKDKKRR